MAGRSIKLFQFMQKYYRAIGIYPHDANQNDRNFFNTKNWILLICLIQLVIPTLAFLLFKVTSMLDFGLSMCFLLGLSVCGVYYVIYIWQIENISKFFENCEMFIKKRSDSSVIYQECSEQIEIFCEWFCMTLLMSLVILLFSALLYSTINYYVFGLAEKSFFLLFSTIMLPFDWRTPFGYFLAWFNQFLGAIAGLLFAVPLYNSIFATSGLFISIADDDLTQELDAFNADVKTANASDRVEITQRFCNIITSYTDAKELVNEFNKVHRFSIFSFFLWAIFGECSVLLMLQYELLEDDLELIGILVSCFMAFWTFMFIFIICEPGQRVADAFVRYYDLLEQCNWHSLPTQYARRLYLMFLLDAQQPINIQCYGGFYCTRSTSEKIINNGFSYFMVLRQIGQV